MATQKPTSGDKPNVDTKFNTTDRADREPVETDRVAGERDAEHIQSNVDPKSTMKPATTTRAAAPTRAATGKPGGLGGSPEGDPAVVGSIEAEPASTPRRAASTPTGTTRSR